MENGASASTGPLTATPDEGDEAPVDGRTARAQRTREAIVEACVALVETGDVRPTAPRIAEQAGVSVRSVFQHFDDLETLFAMVAERAVTGLAGLVTPVDAELPLDERIGQFVAQRAELLEALTPIRRAADVHAPFSPAIRERLQLGHDFFRAELSRVFARELDALPAARRPPVLDLLDVTTTWATWDVLRTLAHRDRDEAAAVVALGLRAALEGPG
ncbi:MAG TPA: TetR/AcrR family transcriptional regulator [Acidimicrobiales bacterium]|nr:TetR/AcrR family transcriptional regulator [Acidimicrobiales bacterium]